MKLTPVWIAYDDREGIEHGHIFTTLEAAEQWVQEQPAEFQEWLRIANGGMSS